MIAFIFRVVATRIAPSIFAGFLAMGVLVPATSLAELSCDWWQDGFSDTDAMRFFNRAAVTDVANCIALGVDVNASQDNGQTALHWVASYGFTKAAEALIDAGTDVNARDDNDRTPLHIAAAHGFADFVFLLVKHRADVNATTKHGETILHWSVFWGRENVTRFLIDNHAEVNVTNKFGESPLTLAKRKGHDGIVQNLVTAGATF